MTKTLIAVRDVDKETFLRFRARAVEQRMKLGDAFTKAMQFTIMSEKEAGPDISNFLKLKPLKVGKKVKWSEEVDEILYG